ncbi:hypothetical protein ACOSP7_004092 [Xanthoceras sorbifolium]
MLRALWSCRALKLVRLSCNFVSGFSSRLFPCFADFVLLCKGSLSQVQFEKLCEIMWRVWFFCNNRIFADGTVLNVDNVVPWSKAYLAEFTAANSTVIGGNSPRPIL